MKLKVITETDRKFFQDSVNDFIDQPVKILDITFQTSFIGEAYQNTVEYVAFIKYDDGSWRR